MLCNRQFSELSDYGALFPNGALGPNRIGSSILYKWLLRLVSGRRASADSNGSLRTKIPCELAELRASLG